MDNPISEHEASLIKNSFKQVTPHSTELTDLFYQSLFERKPELRALFPNNMLEQKSKLLDTLNIIVNGCCVMNKLMPALQDLGRRHKPFNIPAEDYELLGEILISSLRTHCEANWSEETTVAWQKIYNFAASAMMSV